MMTFRLPRLAVLGLLAISAKGLAAAEPFVIEVVDSATGRGVPLVELRTTNEVRFVTDSAGLAVIDDPELLGREVFFQVSGHGYEFPADGFGYRGRRLPVRPGESARLEVKRLNVAERLYRTTGAGIYRDTRLAGRDAPIAEPLLNGGVVGQDSIQAVIFGGKIRWFWGDTSRFEYPLGNFRMAGAVSELPERGGLDPAVGVNYRYFTNEEGFARPMVSLEPREGVVWLDGLVVIPDSTGRPRLLAHYSRRRGLEAELEHGLVLYNEESESFERLKQLDLAERWRFPHGHPLAARDGETEYLYFGLSERNVRVKAEYASLLDPTAYEAWTPLAAGALPEPGKSHLHRNAEGRPHWRWTRDAPPLSREFRKHFTSENDRAETFDPLDVETGKPVKLHGGSVCWNPYRRRYVLISVEEFGRSYLGEVWYGEAEQPTGPWRRVRRIVTHDRYSFYNPKQHDFFDQEGGRIIYFEGTYTREFSGNPLATPRYDYNQVMYRLDLDDPRLAPVRE